MKTAIAILILSICAFAAPPTTAKVTVKPATTAKCAPLPPICAGGMISAKASIAQVNAYWTRWKLTVPLNCRFQPPPKCQTGKKPICHSCSE